MKARLHHVLLVDDDKSILKLYSMALQQRDIECTTAMDGLQAENALRIRPYDAVISDLQMPRLHGHKFLSDLAAKPQHPLLFGLTGIHEPRLVEDLISRGVHDVLLKPIDPDMFAAKIHAHLQRAQSAGPAGDRPDAARVANQLEAASSSLKSQLQEMTKAFEETISTLEKQRDQSEDRLLGSIRLLSKLLGQVGQDEGSHATRVEHLATAIGRRAGIDPESMRHLQGAALLHELGQFGLPDAVRVAPPWALRGKERAAYRRYPEIGATLLSEVEGTERLVEIIECHCEQFDGGGFPRGLQGDAIPIGARILRIADGIDTLRMHRPADNLVDDVLRHLDTKSGSFYDPHLVKLAIPMVKEALAREVEENRARITVEELRPGMQLAADLFSPDDQLLARYGAVVNSNTVERLRKLIPGRVVLIVRDPGEVESP